MPEMDKIYRFSVDPTVNDDSSAGYEIGDEWLNDVSGKLFELLDPSVGAAEWVNKTDLLDGSVSLVDGAQILGANAILIPPSIGVNQDDYSPAGFITGGVVEVSWIIIASSSDIDFTGMEAPSPEIGNLVRTTNNSANDYTFKHNDGGSLAANRFLCQDNGDVTLKPNGTILWGYAPSLSRWIQLNLVP